MPIFEYRCNACNEISEFIVFRKDERLSCSKCGGHDLVKVMSAHNTPSTGRAMDSQVGGGCCGSPGACGSPGSCCSS